jgi:hypothetical protein
MIEITPNMEKIITGAMIIFIVLLVIFVSKNRFWGKKNEL